MKDPAVADALIDSLVPLGEWKTMQVFVEDKVQYNC